MQEKQRNTKAKIIQNKKNVEKVEKRGCDKKGK